MKSVYGIADRYIKNIRKSFGIKDDYMTNKQFGTQVSRSTYMGNSNG